MDAIKIRGARVHNLKNINLDIPKNKLVVFTGVSGSGKSSLAFDTLYAEGQRRYVESLSSYARQFLGIMEKPDVDIIEGLSPAISIDQKTATHNPRSTVGTVTEIYDYLRLLYARIGTPYCPNCNIVVQTMSVDEIVDAIIFSAQNILKENVGVPQGFFMLSPVVKNKRGEFRELFANLLYKGYSWVRIDKYFYNLEQEDLFLFKNNKHNIDVVVDKLRIDKEILKQKERFSEMRSRLFRAVENALALSGGVVLWAHVRDRGFSLPDKPKDLTEQIYSEQFACPSCGMSFPEIEPRLFSFNSPIGACKQCRGLGVVMRVNDKLLYNPSLTLSEGAFFPFSKIMQSDSWFARLVKKVLEYYDIDPNKKIEELTPEQQNVLLRGADKIFRVRGLNREGNMTAINESFLGFAGELERRYFENSAEASYSEYSRYMQDEQCSVCKGERLSSMALSILIGSKNIAQLCTMPIQHEIDFLKKAEHSFKGKNKEIATPILKEVYSRLGFLIQVGLEYLTLSRRANTLSGGEAQRIRLASQIGTGLTGITYVLDEPSIGLHARDVGRLLQALHRLRDIGNTVIVVEHDWETIVSADYIFDFGPYAGKHGGRIIAHGPIESIIKEKSSITGKYLSGKKSVPIRRSTKKSRQMLVFKKCSENNLKNITVSLPLNKMVGITGVSGSGKSTLLLETIYPAIKKRLNPFYKGGLGILQEVRGIEMVERIVLIDQSPIGKTPRSNPATYTGVFTYIREVFASTADAKAQGYKPGRFSFNVRGGRCEHCSGAGSIKVEMQFLADLYVTCEVCGGRRYNRETLDILYKGKTIADVLSMTVDEALKFFDYHAKIVKILKVLQNVGLGYIELGQSAPTLSGGEAQRVKLAKELYTSITSHTVYILDEPTTGLHFYDIEKLIGVLRNLVNQGNSVFLIEHNLDVIKNCDYVVDLGPEGGDRGGQIVFQGLTSDLLKKHNSHTAFYLREYCEHEKNHNK